MKRNSIISVISNPIFVSIFLLVLFCVVSLDPYRSYDEGLWTYMGWLFNEHGIPPYVGAVENKTPAIFLLYKIADNFGGYNIYFVRGLGILITLLTALLLFKIGEKLKCSVTGIIAMWLFGLLTCWKLFDGFSFAQTETFVVFFNVAAFYGILFYKSANSNWKWLFFSGLCIGIAISFKQIALTTLVAFLLMLLWLVKDFLNYIKAATLIVLGTLFSMLLFYLTLYIYGVNFQEYLDGAWLILFNSGSRLDELNRQFTNFSNAFLTSRLVLLLGVVACFVVKRKQFKPWMFVCLMLWFTFDFIGVNASGYYYGHQLKQLLPSLVLIIALFFTTIKLKWVKKDYLLSLLVFAIIALFPVLQIKSNIHKNLEANEADIIDASDTVNFLKNESSNNDFIYLLGADANIIQVLADANRRSSSKYFHSIFITSKNEQSRVLSDLEHQPPKFIIKHKDLQTLEEIYGTEFISYFNHKFRLLRTFRSIEVYTLQY